MQIITGLELRAFSLAKNAERLANSVNFNESPREFVRENGEKFTQDANGENQNSVNFTDGGENADAWEFPSGVGFEMRLKDKSRQLNNLADQLLKEAFAVAGGVR